MSFCYTGIKRVLQLCYNLILQNNLHEFLQGEGSCIFFEVF